MKLLTLAVAIALLGTLFLGCDESKTMMEQVMSEPHEIPMEESPSKPHQTYRGEVIVREADCKDDSHCVVGISYTEGPGENDLRWLTIYFDLPAHLARCSNLPVYLYYFEDEMITHLQIYQNLGAVEVNGRPEVQAGFTLNNDCDLHMQYQLLKEEAEIFIQEGISVTDNVFEDAVIRLTRKDTNVEEPSEEPAEETPDEP